jgi:DNA (cytosine-5)-methyltransferase 1
MQNEDLEETASGDAAEATSPAQAAGNAGDQAADVIPVEQGKLERFTAVLQECYEEAEKLLVSEDLSAQKALLGDACFEETVKLSGVKHAARGIAITLAAYKAIEPTQDVRLHKSDHDGGFSARSIDNTGTIPFLQANSLYYNVETHWLSQTFSFAGPYMADLVLKTQPKVAGPLMLSVVNSIQNSANPVDHAKAVLQIIFVSLIDARNKGKVPLEKPQNLSIDQTIALLNSHFLFGYEKNNPRLPQVAIYAIYECIMPTMARYKNLTLGPLERMKAANRKSGSVGDVDVNKGAEPFEAVEIKFKIDVSREHVAEAIQKIKSVSVQRYLILSTTGVANGEAEEIGKLTNTFRQTNGCEIIVNGVLDTIKYYLRLIDSPASFINRYTSLVEVDPDLGYEHRLAWNAVCAKRHQ